VKAGAVLALYSLYWLLGCELLIGVDADEFSRIDNGRVQLNGA